MTWHFRKLTARPNVLALAETICDRYGMLDVLVNSRDRERTGTGYRTKDERCAQLDYSLMAVLRFSRSLNCPKCTPAQDNRTDGGGPQTCQECASGWISHERHLWNYCTVC